jgi:N,N'-diacetyllegionaminate synthase
MKIIAEIGSVHDGSFGNACKLIEAAAQAGAQIVKFQTHIAEAESLPNAPSPGYFQAEPRMEYFRRTAFQEAQYREFVKLSNKLGVEFLSSPFSLEAVDFLESIGVQSYKIPSGEVSNLPLLERVAETKKTTYLSSGMSDWAEIDAAVKVLKKGGPLVIMQCSSEYPCKPEHVGLNVLTEMAERYKCPVGFSDHTLGFAASLGAVFHGAIAIEKHFTFSKQMYGSDAKHSMEPEEFRKFCEEIQDAYRIAKNPVDKNDLGSYREMKKIFEKSVVLLRDLPAGTILEKQHLAYKKPGDGIRAFEYQKVIGKKLKSAKGKDHKLSWEDFS